MGDFKLDTSGQVIVNQTRIMWSDLGPGTQGFTEAVISALIDHEMERARRAYGRAFVSMPPLGWDFSDLAPETLARIMEIAPSRPGATAEDGVIFWREQQEGQFEGFPPLTVYLGDDGKVRFQ